ncbi:MAG: ACT domain protein, partial [Beggiatoa sp.]|nr:ACT domain protein [Beggiatoa sp.]
MGTDRPGLIEALSKALAAHHGNWLESRIAGLGGRFAGILVAGVPETEARALKEALAALESEGLRITVEDSGPEPGTGESRTVKLELIGQDHPGIVREISEAIARRGVNIQEFSTECLSASWSGETLFKAYAELSVPRSLATAELRSLLEALANELMVDVTLDDLPSG